MENSSGSDTGNASPSIVTSEPSLEIALAPDLEEQVKEATWQSENLVFDRDEYAKKDFWDDRFKETHGFFDWYANWDQIRPKFKELFPDRNDSILMVGCGNSKLSEEMFGYGYKNISNMDISRVVLEKMKNYYANDQSKVNQQSGKATKKKSDFQYITMDATSMNFRDNSFDISIDKGTYDALACGPQSKEILRKLVQEMLRVSSKAAILISSGTPEKRLPFLTEFTEGQEIKIEHFELELSHLANLINILRTELKDRPLSHALKDGELLRKAIQATIEAQERKRMEEESKDPRKKLLRLMLKAKAKRDQEIRDKEQAEANVVNTNSQVPISILPSPLSAVSQPSGFGSSGGSGGGLTVGPMFVRQTTGSYSSASHGNGGDLSHAKNLRIKGSLKMGKISIQKMGSMEGADLNSDIEDQNDKKQGEELKQEGDSDMICISVPTIQPRQPQPPKVQEQDQAEVQEAKQKPLLSETTDELQTALTLEVKPPTAAETAGTSTEVGGSSESTASGDSSTTVSGATAVGRKKYDPQRQDFVMMYVIYKNQKV